MMFIENWVAALLFSSFLILALIPSVGWLITANRLDEAEKQNKTLLKDRGNLRIENLRLKSLVQFHKNEDQD